MKRFAFVSFAVGAVLAAIFVVMLVRTAPSSPQPVGGGLVHLSEDGLKIYASQPDPQAVCKVKTTAEVEVPLSKPRGSERIGINGVNWYLVAQSTEVVPAGDYLVNCVDSEPGTRYAVAPKSSIAIFVVSIIGLVFSLLIFGILGIVLLTIGISRKRKGGGGNTFPGGPGGYPQQPGGPGGYPQPGNAFPGYPPPGNYNPGPNPDRPQNT